MKIEALKEIIRRHQGDDSASCEEAFELSSEESSSLEELLDKVEPGAISPFVGRLIRCGILTYENIKAFSWMEEIRDKRPADLERLMSDLQIESSEYLANVLFLLHLAGVNSAGDREAMRKHFIESAANPDSFGPKFASFIASRFNMNDEMSFIILSAMVGHFIDRFEEETTPDIFQSVMRNSAILLDSKVEGLIRGLPDDLCTKKTLLEIVGRCNNAENQTSGIESVVRYLTALEQHDSTHFLTIAGKYAHAGSAAPEQPEGGAAVLGPGSASQT